MKFCENMKFKNHKYWMRWWNECNTCPHCIVYVGAPCKFEPEYFALRSWHIMHLVRQGAVYSGIIWILKVYPRSWLLSKLHHPGESQWVLPCLPDIKNQKSVTRTTTQKQDKILSSSDTSSIQCNHLDFCYHTQVLIFLTNWIKSYKVSTSLCDMRSHHILPLVSKVKTIAKM